MKKVIVILMACCLICACRKYETCETNCSNFTFKGRVLNMETNTGIPNAAIEVKWRYSVGFGFGGDSKDIACEKTDNQGNFNFTTAIDTSLFGKYSIEVSMATDNSNFLYIPSPFDKHSIHQIFSNNSENLLFQVFPKANLTFKINYPVSNSKSESIDYAFAPNYGYVFFWNKSPNSNVRDTTITVETASGILTKVKWYKKDARGNNVVATDSIKCKKGVENVLKIVY